MWSCEKLCPGFLSLPFDHHSGTFPTWHLVVSCRSHVGWRSRGDGDDCREQRILSQLSGCTKMCSLLWQDLWRECESRPLNPHPRLTAGAHTKLLVREIVLLFSLHLLIRHIGWSRPEISFAWEACLLVFPVHQSPTSFTCNVQRYLLSDGPR